MPKKDKKSKNTKASSNNLLAGMSVDPTAEVDTVDRLGGGWTPLPSNIYLLTINSFHLDTSSKGAKCAVISATTEEGKQHNETIYFTNVKGENFYVKTDDSTGKTVKRMNPNFMRLESLCQLVCKKSMSEMEIKPKYVKVWDDGKQVEQERPMLVELIGKKVYAGILECLKDKQADNGKGVYEPTGETRRSNEITVFFRKKDKLHIRILLTLM